jgi:hypothetical protein
MIRRLLTLLTRPAEPPDPDLSSADFRVIVLEAELELARHRIADLEAELAEPRQVDTMPIPVIKTPAPCVHSSGLSDLLEELAVLRATGSSRELYLRERETNGRLAGEVHRLTMANIAADKEYR